MAIIADSPKAFGGPGIAPRWTHSAKDVVGTAYSAASRVWFTISGGVLSEVYYPTIDRPQIRDLQFLITDGETFFHDERRDLQPTIEYLSHHGLGARITGVERQGRYRLVKEVISNPRTSCVLIDTRLEGDAAMLRKLHLYVLLAPHLEVGGWHNNGNVAWIAGREFLTAHKGGAWLAMAATAPFIGRSCGYAGTTDGWQDLARDFKLVHQFAAAEDGNIVLTGEIDLSRGNHFTLGLGFGRTLHNAVTALFQSLGVPFAEHRSRFLDQWERAFREFYPLEKFSGDGGALYRRSRELLLAHEDKNHPGAIIASLSIPWGEVKGDEDLGGYHLVWTRDMVNSATGLLASGDAATARRALIYLACSQQPDGGFPQNFWIDGQPYWNGIQLDEVAFPVILAWRLGRAGALQDFDPYPMVLAACRYLAIHGPATPQERWEENSGYSPSTLAITITALICAACIARERGDHVTAHFLEQVADFIESHVERWTVTTQGTLVEGIMRHYIRIRPVDPNDPEPVEDPNQGTIFIRNRPPGVQAEFPAVEIVDAGFLELVRYGIRRPDDPLIEASLQVVDQVLKVDFPAGPCWRRYNHDGYGQCDNGSPYQGSGRGRPWPLLTGERGHYELAAGRDPRPYIRAMENFANVTSLLPEQVWDEADRPEYFMYFGRPTGSAMPLMWAHAEYTKLLRSAADGQVFDLIPEVAERYRTRRKRDAIEIWKPNRRIREVAPGTKLRVMALDQFMLHWCVGDWTSATDTRCTPTATGIHFVDIDVSASQRAPLRFTFFWLETQRWEGQDYLVEVKPHA
ncbi:MAG: glycoside hydrolase family 15 protein [Candidatus Binataceae bacterium]